MTFTRASAITLSIFFAILATPAIIAGFTWRLIREGFLVGTAIADAVGKWMDNQQRSQR